MKEYLKAVKVSENVYWVGAIDWNVRNFHGYQTERGTTYNAFLVIDEKITLIDTVKAPFVDELMARIRSVIDPSKIDYIVSNHAEMDHSGALTAVMDAVQPEKLFASPMGEKNLKAHFGADLDITVVKTGDVISLGKQSLHFIETRMLHWPDSMFSYLDGDKILFSQDAFGMHLAGSSLWSDEYEYSLLEHEAKKYYANILLHLSPQIAKLLEAFPSYNLDLAIIAPDHGPLWRRDHDKILELYAECVKQGWKKRALVVYATMWNSTEKLARSLADGIASVGVPVDVASLNANERSAVITGILDAGVVALGAPTMNNQMFPAMADILTYVRGLKPKNHIGFSFGSFGWSGEATKQIQSEMESWGFELPHGPFAVKYVPTEDDLKKAFDFGVDLGQRLLEKLEQE